MRKLKRHGNGGSCLKKHEKLKIKIFAERVMENHIYISIDFYLSISVIKHTIELFLSDGSCHILVGFKGGN
jgi:hypothetical protein